MARKRLQCKNYSFHSIISSDVCGVCSHLCVFECVFYFFFFISILFFFYFSYYYFDSNHYFDYLDFPFVIGWWVFCEHTDANRQQMPVCRMDVCRQKSKSLFVCFTFSMWNCVYEGTGQQDKVFEILIVSQSSSSQFDENSEEGDEEIKTLQLCINHFCNRNLHRRLDRPNAQMNKWRNELNRRIERKIKQKNTSIHFDLVEHFDSAFFTLYQRIII